MKVIAASYNNFANLHSERQEMDKAFDYYNKALAIRVQIYGETHPDVADTYFNMGLDHETMKDYDTAHRCMSKALEIQRSILSEEHPEVQRTLRVIKSMPK